MRNIVWGNVRLIDADEEARILRTFNAIETCFREPAWGEFTGTEPLRELETITCQRCGKLHTYRKPQSGRRRFCDACVRTK